MSPFINTSIGKYHHVDSIIHRLDPRTKLLSLIFFLVSISIADSVWELIIISLFIAIIITLSRVPFLLIVRYIRPMLWLFISILLLHTFFTDSDSGTIFAIGYIKATWQGLYDGFIISYRFLVVVLCVAILVLTTMPISLADGISDILQPLKKIGIPVDQIPVIMMVTLRFMPTLLMEAQKLISSQTIRGSKLEGRNFLRKIIPISSLVAPLMRNSFKMADELALSMESRCYHGGARTHLYELRFHRADYIAIFASAIIIPLTIVLNHSNCL